MKREGGKQRTSERTINQLISDLISDCINGKAHCLLISHPLPTHTIDDVCRWGKQETPEHQ